MYSPAITLASFVLLIYWKLESFVYIMMVSTTRIRQYSFPSTPYSQLFQSETVLECVFISAICII